MMATLATHKTSMHTPEDRSTDDKHAGTRPYTSAHLKGRLLPPFLQ